MTSSKLALFALAAAALVSANAIAAGAAPFGDQGSRYVQSQAGVVESGIDQAKGGIR